MFSLFKKIFSLISYCYFRYTVVTEMYMVEPWERMTVHTTFGLFFLGCWYFNSSFLLPSIRMISMLLKEPDFADIQTVPISN